MSLSKVIIKHFNNEAIKPFLDRLIRYMDKAILSDKTFIDEEPYMDNDMMDIIFDMLCSCEGRAHELMKDVCNNVPLTDYFMEKLKKLPKNKITEFIKSISPYTKFCVNYEDYCLPKYICNSLLAFHKHFDRKDLEEYIGDLLAKDVDPNFECYSTLNDEFAYHKLSDVYQSTLCIMCGVFGKFSSKELIHKMLDEGAIQMKGYDKDYPVSYMVSAHYKDLELMEKLKEKGFTITSYNGNCYDYVDKLPKDVKEYMKKNDVYYKEKVASVKED